MKKLYTVLIEEKIEYKITLSWKLFKQMSCYIKQFIADEIGSHLDLNNWNEVKYAYLFFPYMHSSYCEANKMSNDIVRIYCKFLFNLT